MSSEPVVAFKTVWKKYSKGMVFHKSFREDIMNILKRGNNGSLKESEFWALQNVNFSIKKGECVGLYGPNGSGKTTILKLIASVTYPNIGEVTVKGKIAPLIEIGAGFHPDLSGRENIYMNGAIIGMTLTEIRDKIDDIIKFSELENFIDMPVKKYSSGMYLRLGFSIAVHSSAKLLLMDEILSVGDEQFQKKCLEKINDIRSQNRTIILVSHDRLLMERITDRMIFLQNGETVAAL